MRILPTLPSEPRSDFPHRSYSTEVDRRPYSRRQSRSRVRLVFATQGGTAIRNRTKYEPESHPVPSPSSALARSLSLGRSSSLGRNSDRAGDHCRTANEPPNGLGNSPRRVGAWSTFRRLSFSCGIGRVVPLADTTGFILRSPQSQRALEP